MAKTPTFLKNNKIITITIIRRTILDILRERKLRQ